MGKKKSNGFTAEQHLQGCEAFESALKGHSLANLEAAVVAVIANHNYGSAAAYRECGRRFVRRLNDTGLDRKWIAEVIGRVSERIVIIEMSRQQEAIAKMRYVTWFLEGCATPNVFDKR